MTELKLEVGKTYVDREGNNVTIARVTNASTYSFLSGEDKTYMADGRYVKTVMSGYDLISEYVEPTPATPARIPHKWAKEMHAFADGYEIEYFFHVGGWLVSKIPSWNGENEYRIKPEPAPLLPNDVRYIDVCDEGTLCYYTAERQESSGKSVRIEFNPNDQTLVSASVVTL